MDDEEKLFDNASWQNRSNDTYLNIDWDMPVGVQKDCLILEYNPYNNEKNEITYETMKLVLRVIGGCLIPLVCLFGCPINVLNAVVFYKQGLRERINMLLFCLACCDFLVEAFLFVSTIEYAYTQLQGNFAIDGPLVTFVMNYLSMLYGSVYVSAFMTTLISFERCICVTRPLIAKNVLKTRTMAIIVGVAAVALTIFIYIFSVEKYRLRCGYYPPHNLTLNVHYPSDFYLENRPLMDVLNMVVYGVILPSFFVLSTAITTAITAVKLRGAAHWRHEMVPESAAGSPTSAAVDNIECKEIALTKMLIAVSCLFIITTIPNVVTRIGPLTVEEFRLGGRKGNLLLCGIAVVYLANAINSSFNFVFYYKMGSRFRESVKSLFSRGRRSSITAASNETNEHKISI